MYVKVAYHARLICRFVLVLSLASELLYNWSTYHDSSAYRVTRFRQRNHIIPATFI